jgi:ribosomal protein L37AE/L43A
MTLVRLEAFGKEQLGIDLSNPNMIACPQCKSASKHVKADKTWVYGCQHCGYPSINWKKQPQYNQRIQIFEFQNISNQSESKQT